MDLKVKELYIYPVKSLGGISVLKTDLSETGPEWDRKWMLLDENHRFMSQRKWPGMAMLQTVFENDGVSVFRSDQPDERIKIPFDAVPVRTETKVDIWGHRAKVGEVDNDLSRQFSLWLNTKCRLVSMPDSERRKKVISRGDAQKEIDLSFSDGYPFLIIGEHSLSDLNKRLTQPVSVNRFRPNIVFSGGQPYEEELWQEFSINGIPFRGIKPCPRCKIPTINQETAIPSPEPLKTLASYKMKGNEVLFGMNAIAEVKTGTLKVGDHIEIVHKLQ